MVLAHNINEGQRTSDIQITVDVTFESMLLTTNTLEGLKNSGFYKPSPVQLHGIPLGKCGFDLFIEAKSGTGKTAVFTVIALEKLELDKGLQSVILAPTREIAAQISDVIKQIGSHYEGLSVEVVMGGLPIEDDIKKFQKNVHILVGSPGRMRHLIQNKHIEVSAVRLLVLDEADKLMDKSFQADINYIFSVLPKQKQVIMSSATYPDTLKSTMQNYVQKAQHICPDSTSVLLGIKQFVTSVKCNVNIVRQTQNKFEELLKILSNHEFKQCLVFCNYQARVGELCKMLIREKWPAEQLHGQLEQTDRLDALKTLQEYKCRILVSTDLAARGIDASNVDLVINFEPPFEWQTYLHRIGRAGRFGSYGIAITILSEGKEESNFNKIIKSINHSINLNNLWSGKKIELCDFNTNGSPVEISEKVLPSKINEESCKVLKVEAISNMDDDETSKIKEICKGEDLNVEESCEISEAEKNVNIIMNRQFDQVLELENNYVSASALENGIEENWKVLMKTSKSENNELEQSFATIFPFFEDQKELKLESFSELMDSFKVYEPNNNKFNEIQDVTFKLCMTPVPTIEPHFNINIESSSDSDDNAEKQKRRDNHNISISGNCKEENFGNISSNNTNVHSIKIGSAIQDSLHKNDYTDLSEAASKNALKAAGLPTSFGCKKKSYKNLVHRTNISEEKVNTTSEQPFNNLTYTKTRQNYVCPQINSKSLNGSSLRRSLELSDTTHDDGYNTHTYLNSRSIKEVQRKNKERQNTHVKNIKSNNLAPTTSNEVFESNNNEEYIVWYKQLKSCMKQIEMSLYINELSRI